MGDLDVENKPVDEEQGTNGLTNGISNGTPEHKEHKHSPKDKDRDRSKDKDRHRDKDRHKSSHRDKDRDKDKERSKDRHSSSHKSSHKDKDKEKSRDKDKDRDRHRDKERSDRDKDKERNKERSDRDKHKDKERSDRDKDRNRDKEDRHKDRERSDKDKERRDKDKERSDKHRSRDKDKDRHRDDKDKKSSSSSSSRKDKHSSSHKSSHKDKHRDRDRVKEEKVLVKEEIEAESQEEYFNSGDEKLLVEGIKEEESEEDNLVIKEENTEEEEEEEQQYEEEEQQQYEEEEAQEQDEEDDDDDVPLLSRKRPKREYVEEDDDDDVPLIARKKKSGKRRKKTEEEEDEDFKPVKISKKKRKKVEDDDEEDFKPAKKKVKKEKVKANKSTDSTKASPTKGKKKSEEEQHVWKWWEEEKREDGRKWTSLEHKGPVFADPYIRLPSNIKFYYDGEHVLLSEGAEEVATFYAKMLDHDYTTKEIFNKNFFKDWKKMMTSKERELIKDLSKCNFKKMHAFFVQQNEERKNRTKEEKKALKEKNEAIVKEYGWCIIDGHKQKIGNFKIEPPGLFRGRGEHPKQGMVKRRTMPEDVRINCSKDSNIPKAPAGHRWKEVRHDTTVTWLACWNENIQGSTKYVMLNAASKLKGEKDWQKYETARKLHKHVDKIRESYKADWKSKEMRIRQRGVALYFIDKLALRAGNEKDEDQADTVGCCSIRVEHLRLHEKKDGKEFVVVFDFLGKDSIRYYNEVPVEKRVFKNLQLFMENKQDGDDVFDRLNTQILNKYLNELLDGLTAKVFRTYNASRTLQEQLEKMTVEEDPIPSQILSYNRANREVAILCNHQRAVPKTFDKSMANLQKKIDDKKELIHDAERELKDLKRAAKHGGTVKEKVNYEKKKKAVERLKEQLEKLEISATDKEENKQIALGTSKLNYLDPRITVAWCKKNNIPVDKVYNKTQRLKFQWAIDMATADFNFMNYDSSEKFKGEADDEEEEEEDEE